MEKIENKVKSTTEIDEAKESPKSMPFILCNIFIERFSSAGITAILALYFHKKLDLDTNLATSVFHLHEVIAYSFTIVGAIIADSWWGHFKAIIWMQLIFSIGATILSIGNIEPLNLSIAAMTVVGLIPMAISTGSIRVNLSIFGANQYKLPAQAAQLSVYFTLQYFVLKCGSIIGRLATPILRQDVKCFGMNDCYSLSFGVTALAMFAGLLILVCGNSSFVKKPPSGNMLIKVFKCFQNGIAGKVKAKFRNTTPKEHWLDYAEEKFGSMIVKDTKTVVNILVLFLPLPIYWAVYVQQGSRWVFQATRMNGDIGFYTVKPDQMIIFNSIAGISMIPVCNYILYPLTTKIGLGSNLHRMTIGGMLAVVAFVMSGFVEIEIGQRYISIFWLLPQYLTLALGENFLYIANLTFAYKEAPPSMKSAMQAFAFITIALGNAIVSIISGTRIFQSQSAELFFFAGILFIDQIVFAYLASKYKYREDEPKAENLLTQTKKDLL